ncbi:hypothetical protein G9C98_001333 [Cotesia typhae]|uniref:Inosine/uridine-preferring nucleoside hydrolase domain-containing protein n=1 Tax=Cotesia typhae TaxID=2053667 RepID=A0A8J5V5G4_9HYME|nr:hypothetical protein G9C98_001333 [Cotesia typhae]
MLKKKVIVDCDGGTDDAVSLVPVYKGANSSLISLESILVKAADFKYHGNDGFGDVLQEEVNIISVVCLGPLTNIALAIKIYPEILDSVKDFYVMGGNSMGLGNTTSQAEFNFYADPESVHMFLQSNTKPLWIFPWETCLKTYIPMDWREEISLKAGSQEKMKLITEIEDGAYKNKDKREYYCPCDAFCAAAVVNSSVIKRYEECHMDVELHGIKTPAEIRYHGHDGFGDVFVDGVNTYKLEKEHAVIGIRKIITDNPDQVSVVCLGPLTNVALAVKIYPEILEFVKEFFIMGGNSTGQGNTTAQAEFNFYADPESVHILFQSNLKPLWLFPWETCLKSTVTMDWRENKLGKLKENKKIELITKIEDGIYKNKIKREIYRPCDAFCVAALINPKIITHFQNCHADIELHGVKTRGFVAIDHLRNNIPNINLVSDLDFEEFKSLMLDSFQE